MARFQLMAPLLPLRLRPFYDESLVGFLVRLAERNAHQTATWLLHQAGIWTGSVEISRMSGIDFPALGKGLGVAPDEIKRLAYISVEMNRDRSFFGSSLGADLISLNQRRFCPQCLQESGHHRAIWDINVVTVCPLHQVRLVNTCPSCCRKPGWIHVPLTKCSCGARFDKVECACVPDNELMGIREVYRVLNWQHGHEDIHVPLPLQMLSPTGSIKLMVSLGWYLRGAAGRPRVFLAQNPDTHLILSDGYSACCQWPASFYLYLDTLRSGAGKRPGRFGIFKEFGPLADWMLKGASEELQDFITSALRGYLESQVNMTTRCTRARSSPDGAMVITIPEAAAVIGTNLVRVRKVLRRYSMTKSQSHVGRGEPELVERHTAQRLASEFQDLLGKQELVCELGCSRKDVEAIAASSLLPRVTSGPAFDLLGRPTAWRKSDCRALMSKLARLSSKDAPFDECVHLSQSFALFRRAGIGPPEVIKRALHGGIKLVRMDPAGHGLSCFMVDKSGVPSPAIESRVSGASVSLMETSRLLHLKRQVAYQLCAAGLIQTTGGSKKRDRRVQLEEIWRFQAKFVVASQLGRDRGHHKGWTADKLKALGATPVSGPSVDGRRQYVFLRSDVEKIDLH